MLPTTHKPHLIHIGTLDPAHKGQRGASYEGAGLSVSDHPDQWRRIAQLGGLPWWRLERPGGTFIDRHALTDAQWEDIIRWGEAHGLVARTAVVFAEIEDDEIGTYVQAYATRGALEDEFDGDLTGAVWWEGEQIVATPELEAAVGQSVAGDARDVLLTVYAERTQQVDGIWWEDAPGPYSAPRGVILPGRLGGWEITPHVTHAAEWDPGDAGPDAPGL